MNETSLFHMVPFSIRSVFCIALFFQSSLCHSQYITGAVIDKVTGKAVPFASVYFNGTFKGTTSNDKGEFRLLPVSTGLMPVTASAIGYLSATVYEFPSDLRVMITLEPKVYDIESVIVKPDKMPRSRKEKQFKREFLGRTPNALRCTIENMEDIGLVFNENNNSLMAFCENPILINNKALKYRIKYFLENFIISEDSIFMSGNYFFTEVPDALTKNVLYKRKETYLGSRMHFIRSLWNDRLEEEGFKVKLSDTLDVGYHDMVVETPDHQKDIIRLKDDLYVYYRYYHKSLMILRKDSVHIETNGYNDFGLQWGGFMAIQRTADLLPFEYEPVP